MGTAGRNIAEALRVAFIICLCLAIVLSTFLYFMGTRVLTEKQSAYYEKISVFASGIIGWVGGPSFAGMVLAVLNVALKEKPTRHQRRVTKKIAYTLCLTAILGGIVPGGVLVAAFIGEISPPPSVVGNKYQSNDNDNGDNGGDDEASDFNGSLDPHPWNFINSDKDIDEQVTYAINWLEKNKLHETPERELTEIDYRQKVDTAAKKEKKASADYPVVIRRHLSEEEITSQRVYRDILAQKNGPIDLRIEADTYGKTFANRWQLIKYHESIGDISLRLSDYNQAFIYFQDAYYWCIEALLIADTEQEIREVIKSLSRLFGINNDRLGDQELIKALPESISSNQLSNTVAFWGKLLERRNEFLGQGD